MVIVRKYAHVFEIRGNSDICYLVRMFVGPCGWTQTPPNRANIDRVQTGMIQTYAI